MILPKRGGGADPASPIRTSVMDWNEERTATLRKLWLEGLSASQVARQLGGVSRSAVIGKVHRLGITVRELPPRPRATVRVARAQPRARDARDTVQTPRSVPPRPARIAPTLVEMSPTASIVGLSTHSCRWPIGDPGMSDFGFCGRDKLARASYCEDHARGAFRRFQSPADVETWNRQALPVERRIG
jgi:GcrA cell cycle regulator